MSLIPENPLFPNPVLPKTSVNAPLASTLVSIAHKCTTIRIHYSCGYCRPQLVCYLHCVLSGLSGYAWKCTNTHGN